MSCPECFSGHVHNGEPKGGETKIYGFDAYIVEPEAGKPVRGTIVLIPDALGWDFVNIRILADHFCDKGSFRCILPDLMDGRTAPKWILKTFNSLMKGPWYAKPYHAFFALIGVTPFLLKNTPGKAFPRAVSFFTALRRDILSRPEAEQHPIGCAGYCWGGKLLAMLSDPSKAPPVPDNSGKERACLLDVGYSAHPSMLKIPGEVEAMQVPASWAIGSEDAGFPEKTLKLFKEAVAGKQGDVEGEVKVYPGGGHGFAVRAEEAEAAMKAADQAEDQAVDWFLKCFSRL
ncbi:Dienelactone hydrolase family protein [Zalerion maritima]|uniref:Dienelactone hydrolase family protein n=1 Tax=Zalerion maritima TaxID=339359 RepID=A0AAD5RKF4_9PEZI|nr:Dienelactone hydrolase family protein [Zalerion maritima]